MSVTTVGTATHSFTSGQAAQVTLPTGIQSNDLIVVYVGSNGYNVWTPATGYTLEHNGGSSGSLIGSALYYKLAAGTESGTTPSWGSAGSVDGGVIAIVLRGVDTSTPFLGVSADTSGSGSPTAAGSVSWAGAADAVSLLAFTWQGGATTATLPSGWNDSPDGANVNDGFEYSEIGCDLTTKTSVTSLAAQTVTIASGPYGVINQYALKVGAGGGAAATPNPRMVNWPQAMWRSAYRMAQRELPDPRKLWTPNLWLPEGV